MNTRKNLGVILGLSFLVLVLAPNVSRAAVSASNATVRYAFEGGSLVGYDVVSGQVLSKLDVCGLMAAEASKTPVSPLLPNIFPTVTPTMACNKAYLGGVLFNQILVDDDELYLIGQKTTNAQRSSYQETFATVIMKFDIDSQNALSKAWTRTIFVPGTVSNLPVASSLDNDVVSVTVASGINTLRVGRRVSYNSRYLFTFDAAGVQSGAPTLVQ